MIPVDGWGMRSNPYNTTTVTTIRPIKDNALVAAIDSSSVKLAETEDGSVYGIKCGVATAYACHTLMHFKIGPVLFYLSEKTIHESELEEWLSRLVVLDDDLAKRLIRGTCGESCPERDCKPLYKFNNSSGRLAQSINV